MATSAALVFAGKSVAAPAISFLINKAFSYLNEHGKAEGMDEVKNRLLLTMPKIQAVFDVVNPERIREQSSALDAWLWQLRDAVEEAEDAIDELDYYELEKKAKERKVSDWGSSFAKMKLKIVRSAKHVSIVDKTVKKFTNRVTFNKLMKAVDGLDKAAAGVAGFLTLTDHLNGVASSSHQQAQLVNNDRQTGSILSATKFVGREKEKEHIIRWLTNTSVEASEIPIITNSVPIISVVGHGGMGKTTLAQSICEEDEVLKHFKVIWVTVSTSFDATSVTSKILECATGNKPSANHLEPLQQDLKEKVKSLNFLLVLDDVWEDRKREEWEKLFAPLRKVNTKSKILLTTRMQSVADMATSVMGVERDKCLKLGVLEEDECIELFNHHVFSGLNPQAYAYLKLTGEQIARKLGGCPLVIKVASGHLQANMTLDCWNRFLHEGLEHFKGTSEDIFKVLRFSYYHLPTELQICFRYCSLFPEDHHFRKKDLVQMWMGSGLISHATSVSLTFEDIGEQFLAELTRKSFFDLKSRVCDGGMKEEYYIMHDLLHELARKVSSGECARFTDPDRFEDENYTVRHLCITCIHNFCVEEVKKISHFKNLRTIIVDSYQRVDKDMVCALETIVESSKSLRLFHSALRNTFHFAEKFGNLKHLRYIYVFEISPEGIYGVVKLYHLMLLHCDIGLQTETKQLRYLGNLDHLRYVSYGLQGFGEFSISRLTSLQELDGYRIQGDIGNKMSAIGNLRGLRRLELKDLDNIENHEEVLSAKLSEKQYLNSLSLEWSGYSYYYGVRNREQMLALYYLEPHDNIRELQISGYGGLKLPCWIENISVKNLVSLKLRNCMNLEHLPSLGEFALLIHLVLENLATLRQIGQSSHVSCSSSMELLLPPNLHTLEICECQELTELPILPPSLVSLKIEDAGLTKLPIIGTTFSESIQSNSSQLMYISVTNCPALSSLEGSLLEQKLYMEALCTLYIEDCAHLELLPIALQEMAQLSSLRIRRCPKLRILSGAGDKLLPSSLELLTLEECGDVSLQLLGSLRRLTNLSSLVLSCSGLVSLPSADVFKSLNSLDWVNIQECKNLSSLGGLGSLRYLERLIIFDCNKLTEGGSSLASDASGGEEEYLVEPPSSLQIGFLQIDLPSLLSVELLESLCHTKKLVIHDGSGLENLPERWLLQNSQSLQSLSIGGVMSLESLPPNMRSLSSLDELELSDVGHLQSLPDLPSSLQKLYISRCNSELEKKIRKHGSPEWNKISHIPLVMIGDSSFIMGKKCRKETFNELRNSDQNTLTSWLNQQKDTRKLHWWNK